MAGDAMIKRISLLLAFVLFLPLVDIAAPEERAEAPVFKEGDFWKFKVTSKPESGASPANKLPNGIFILRYAKGAIQVRELVDEKEIVSEQLDIPVLLCFRQGPRAQDLQFPFYLGKEWPYSYKVTITQTAQLKVVALERVATQAGTFQTFKIDKTLQWSIASVRWGTGIKAIRGTYFYSPETKSIVKFDSVGDTGFARSIELLKFETSR